MSQGSRRDKKHHKPGYGHDHKYRRALDIRSQKSDGSESLKIMKKKDQVSKNTDGSRDEGLSTFDKRFYPKSVSNLFRYLV